MKTKTFPVYLAVLCLAAWRLPAAGGTGAPCFVAESGTGIIYEYAADGTQTVFATNTGRPYGLNCDSAGNLFVANFNGGVFKIAPNGSESLFANLYNGPAGLAVDNSSNLFVGVYGNGYIFKYAPDGTQSIFGQEPDQGSGNGRPVGLAFDHAGTLYASDEYYGLIYRGVSSSPFAYPPGDPWGLAFDSQGNLFVADSSGGALYKYANINGTLSSSYTTFATGMAEPTGLACDSNDSLFVADYTAGKVYKFDTNGVQTTFASGLHAPIAVAFSPVSQPTVRLPLIFSLTGNRVVVSWQNAGSYTLQQNNNLANTSGWETSGYAISTTNGTNSITITSPTGNVYFRLRQ